MNLTIEEQKQILSNLAVKLLLTGKDFEMVNDSLNDERIRLQFDMDINVDAIRYLAKDKLGLHDYQKTMRNELTLDKSIFLLDGRRGTYIPQEFAEDMLHPNCRYEFVTDSPSKQNTNRSYYWLREMLNELVQGQDNEYYWDNWNDILSSFSAIRHKSTNELFYLTQMEDGHLYLIHEDEIEQYNEDCDSSLDYNAFTLTVDLNERGMYRCHVENCVDDVIWEADTDYVSALQEDGWIRFLPHEDFDRLTAYLKSIHIIGENSKLTYNN